MATVSMAVSDASGDSAVIEWLIRAIRIMGNDALQGNGNAQPRPPRSPSWHRSDKPPTRPAPSGPLRLGR